MKLPTKIVLRIHKFQNISRLTFQITEVNCLGNKLGIKSKFKLNERKVMKVKPLIRINLDLLVISASPIGSKSQKRTKTPRLIKKIILALCFKSSSNG